MFKSMKAIAAIMLTAAMILVAGCKPEDEPNNGGGNNGGGTYHGHAYVDLGLPSGTLWATCNVGATSPEGYGDYFAWGETASKSIYSWSTYKYYNGGNGQLQFTKYCHVPEWGYNGFTDNLTTLLPEDDAATTNWGEGWCTPTVDQWRELRDYTIIAWATQNGVGGRLLTASNGNSLFLPAAGYHRDDELNGAGRYGYYWSNSLDGSPRLAFRFFFSPDQFGVPSENRSGGVPVRPVRSSH